MNETVPKKSHISKQTKRGAYAFTNSCFKEMEKYIFKNSGASLMVQWLRLCAPYAGDLGLFPGQGPRSHMLQLKKRKRKKILHENILGANGYMYIYG